MAADLETYKHPHESNVEWGLRKKFLEAHYDKFSDNLNRLLCLASCFINIEMYGCRYPNQVMIEIKGLIEEIADDVHSFRQAMQQCKGVKFVKAGESESESKPSGKHYGSFVKSGEATVKTSNPSGNPDNVPPAKPNYSGSLKGFVKSGELASAEPTAVKQNQPSATFTRQMPSILSAFSSGESTLLDKFYQLAEELKVAKLLYNVTNKLKMSVTTTYEETKNGFICNLEIDSVHVATSSAQRQKKMSKADACEKAMVSLSKPYLSIKTLNPTKKVLYASDYQTDPMPGEIRRSGQPTGNIARQFGKQKPKCGNKRRYDESISVFDEFFLLQHKQATNATASGILHQSAGFSKKPLNFEYNNVSGQTQCTITVQGYVIGDVVADNKVDAKQEASEVALKCLREKCWTFLMKQTANSDEASLSRTEILGDEEKKTEELPDSNIGSKLMKMMGWSGGGIGKNQQGIKEPINVSTVINREGLGRMAAQGINKNFQPQIKSTIQNYARSDKEEDLVFSPDFTKEERALIHNECKKLNLKSHSHGSNENRYLIVSRKRSVPQLFTMLQQQGGENNKYQLIPPGSEDMHLDSN